MEAEMYGWLIGIGVLIVLVVVTVLAKGTMSSRWDQTRKADSRNAEAGDAATMMMRNPVALPMHDHSFDKPR
jgi:hypothetical protein